ncbi:MAG: hypothetical protein WC144_05045 [Sulfurimonas sp.]|jgi:DNA-directed RNA polymerase subunit N (RpoN/RPB10)
MEKFKKGLFGLFILISISYVYFTYFYVNKENIQENVKNSINETFQKNGINEIICRNVILTQKDSKNFTGIAYFNNDESTEIDVIVDSTSLVWHFKN